MDFSTAGIKEGFIKGLKVLGYVALSAIVTELITWTTNWKPNTQEWVIVQTVINYLLVWVKNWLTTKK